MSSTLRLLTLASIFPLFLSSCTDRVPTTYEPDRIMPLEVGNFWVAEVTEQTLVSADDDIWNVTTSNDTVRIVGEATGGIYRDKGGKSHWYEKRNLHTSECEVGPYALYPGARGDTFSTAPPAQVLLPRDTGEPEIQDVVITQQIVAVDTVVTVGAGSFRCYHYSPVIVTPQSGTLMTQEERFYAPGVGPVLIERRNMKGRVLYRWELREYNVSGDSE